MEERTQGIVLRTRLLTETSLIVHWLTADAGRIATVAKGARRPKSVFRGKLDLFYEAELTFRRSRTSDLHTLCEISPRGSHPELRADYQALSQAAYGSALLEQTTEMDTPMPEVWELFLGYLGSLTAPRSAGEAGMAARSPLPILALELRHLTDLGQAPDLDRQSLSVEARALAKQLLQAEWSEVSVLPVDARAALPLARFLYGFLQFHLGRVPKGRAEALRLEGLSVEGLSA